MFGAIYVGLSGLNAYSRGLQAVSGNVANLNAQGFKASSVSFSDVIGSQSPGLALAGGDGSGDHGVQLADPRVDLAQGELRQTDRDLDLAVDGSGFLTLLRGSEVSYTRTGSFQVDKDGYIVLAGTEYRLATLDTAGRPVSLSVDGASTSVPKATTKIVFSGNVSSSATTFTVADTTVYDANGTAHVWQVKLDQDAANPGHWTVTVTDDQARTVGTQTISFTNGSPDAATSKFDLTDSNANLTVSLDFSGATSFSSGSVNTLRVASVDGYKLGTITSVTVNDKGALEIGYSNEQKVELGTVAIADFRNPQALKQRSGGLFTDAGTAGRQLLSTGDPRVGKVVSRRLEASNVDLSKEFGDLILIQRGFQASSQIISVSNDMIQQLFGIRGQG